jgi:hypothetical protein
MLGKCDTHSFDGLATIFDTNISAKATSNSHFQEEFSGIMILRIVLWDKLFRRGKVPTIFLVKRENRSNPNHTSGRWYLHIIFSTTDFRVSRLEYCIYNVRQENGFTRNEKNSELEDDSQTEREKKEPAK